MNIVIFAGGSGKRFWPISRKKYPKQFQPIIDNKSTIELLVESVVETYGWNHIFISTTELLVSLVKNIFPQLPTQNIITEPVKRDLGPAVGLTMAKLQKLGAGKQPTAVLWSDSFPAKINNFKKVLKIAQNQIIKDPSKLIWLAQKPSFANENIGWIEVGEKIGEDEGVSYYEKQGFEYCPSLKKAEKWTKSNKHLWNTGFFVTTPNFILKKFKQNNKQVFSLLEKIIANLDTEKENETLQNIYPQMPSIHFDHIVFDHLQKDETVVIAGDFEWSDPGTLYALKQFLQKNNKDNVKKGNVYAYKSQDCLIYNYVKNQLVSTIELDGYLVVNTPDALLVCPKNKVKTIKEMLKEFKDTKLEKYL